MAIAELPSVLRLAERGVGHYRAGPEPGADGRGMVFGGQILALVILASEHAATTASRGKEVATVHTVFARSASPAAPLDIDVEVLHDGRTAASETITVRQGERLCARALLWRQADGADLIRHQPVMPDVGRPEDGSARLASGLVVPGTEVRVVGDVDVWDPAAPVGPAELMVWIKLPATGGDAAVNQALLAYATDGFLIGTSMRPHAGIGQSMAHGRFSTGVVTHTLTFYETVSDDTWLLMAQEGIYAGKGRSHGRAQVFSADGQLLASFVQDSIIREGGTT